MVPLVRSFQLQEHLCSVVKRLQPFDMTVMEAQPAVICLEKKTRWRQKKN